MLQRIVTNTPVWVWFLLLGLVVVGITQSRSRHISLRRALILPVVMTGLSIAGTVSSFGAAPPVLLAWSVAAGSVAWLVGRRPVPARTTYDPDTGLFYLPGSLFPLMLMLGVFLVKYIVGVLLAMQPSLVGSASFAVVVAILYGAMSGVFAGRAARLWKISRRSERASALPEAA
ncbi:hypothetical protein AYR66_12145 [Noviherbaspirillum denitrificans]|uniref:Transmembrane protein n=2 Tax=Noviherbaspirillum denitrificans TaxID=1968433 RepID=A0A254TBX0_9BURK|nr:DUF6622 family protein [Noviherbaspirillum denitrificans]OWW20134.1 hypothetical protein AYR66_12145 [Noviherbaspirillum denitrificans]